MYVLTINQRDSRSAGDQVDSLLRTLRHVPAVVPFRRSVGDEAQGIVQTAHDAVDAALRALREGRWNVGIGAGTLPQPLPDDVMAVRGEAMVRSRRAVNRAQRTGERIPLAVDAPHGEAAVEAEAVLRLVGAVVAERSAAEWRVLDLLTPGARGQQKLVAAELGISPQAVSKAVLRSSWLEEWACRPAAARLLDLAAVAAGGLPGGGVTGGGVTAGA